jgi:hypothetical protein
VDHPKFEVDLTSKLAGATWIIRPLSATAREVGKSFRYLLTDPRQFDILQSRFHNAVWTIRGREHDVTRICVILLSVLALAVANVEAWAQAWPTRPIRAIVAFSAGGIVDVIARVVCDQLSTQLRQPVVVENRAGAGTTIAAAFVAKSDPDGYTIPVNSSAHTISPSLQPNLTLQVDAELGCILGQPLHATPCAVGLLPPQALRPSRHGVWAEAVVISCSCTGSLALVGLTQDALQARVCHRSKAHSSDVPWPTAGSL